MLDYIEQFGLSETDRTKYSNELNSLHYLKVGLDFLYKNVKKIEDKVAEQMPQDKCILSYGNDPSMAWTPHELISCSFLWYSVSICDYAQLVGWIRHNNNPNSPTARAYRNQVIPPAVVNWRDKFGAHHARADDDKRDNPAERMVSVFKPFGFYNGRFCASPMKLTIRKDNVVSKSDSISMWSLTEVHEQLQLRYWPEV